MSQENKTILLKDSERTLCEIWSRVMGYLRPYDNYNIGKMQEHLDRKLFTEEKAISKL